MEHVKSGALPNIQVKLSRAQGFRDLGVGDALRVKNKQVRAVSVCIHTITHTHMHL